MADSDLSRTHPYTVIIRSATLALQLVFGLFAAVVLVGSGQPVVGLTVGGLVVLATLVSTAISWISWWHFRFGVVDDDLLVIQGVLIRRRRAIPLARVQGVDIRADLFSRLLGLAEVVVQTAGGGAADAEARIRSIPLSQAESLRADLLHGKDVVVTATAAAAAPAAASIAGADPVGRMSDLRGVLGGPEARGVETAFEYRLPLIRLVVAGATSNAVFVAAAAMVLFATEIAELLGIGSLADATSRVPLATPFFVVGGGMLALVFIAISVAVVVARDFGFVARRAGSRIETESGLLGRRMTSLPVARIQAVRVEQTPLRRLLGFAAVYADTAGFGPGDQERSALAPALLPLVRTQEVRPLLHGLLPEGADFPRTQRVPRYALRFYVLLPTFMTVIVIGALAVGSVVLLPAVVPDSQATILVPMLITTVLVLAAGWVAFHRFLMWRAAEFGVDPSALTIQSGGFGIRRVLLARNRIQALSVRQNPFQKRVGLATLTATTVTGSSASVHTVRHMLVSDAARVAEWYSPSPRPTNGGAA